MTCDLIVESLVLRMKTDSFRVSYANSNIHVLKLIQLLTQFSLFGLAKSTLIIPISACYYLELRSPPLFIENAILYQAKSFYVLKIMSEQPVRTFVSKN